MTDMGRLLDDLVTANRILADNNVLDSFGHVSIRHPGNPSRFLMSRARAPACIEIGDIMEFTLEGEVVGAEPGKPYSERFIHGAILEARPEVMSVVHNHSPNVVPFSVMKKQCFCAIMHMAAPVGRDVPNWDIRDRFGDGRLYRAQRRRGCSEHQRTRRVYLRARLGKLVPERGPPVLPAGLGDGSRLLKN
jgi:ribulose-5-phosphate 4-epimerase/fuculose-1-phosphate aldolase